MAWSLFPGTERQTPGFAYVTLTLTALFLASNHIIGRAVHGHIPPIGLSFWRWVVGIIILLPFALHGLKHYNHVHGHSLREHLGGFALLGGLMVGGTTLMLIALTKTFAINVSVINAVQPTLTVFIAWIAFREKLARGRALGLLMGFAGVLVMVTRADLGVLIHMDLYPGDFIALLAMCGFAAYALNLKRLPRDMNVVVALFLMAVCGTAMLLPFYLWEAFTVKAVPFDAMTVSVVVALGLLVSVFGNLCWYAGNRIIGPQRASIFINLIPVFGIALAIPFLGEKLHLYHVGGGLLVVIGLVLAAGQGFSPKLGPGPKSAGQ